MGANTDRIFETTIEEDCGLEIAALYVYVLVEKLFFFCLNMTFSRFNILLLLPKVKPEEYHLFVSAVKKMLLS